MKAPTCDNEHPSQNVCCWCGKGRPTAYHAVMDNRTRIFHPTCPMCMRHVFGYSGPWPVKRVRRILSMLGGINPQEGLI